MSQKKVLYGTLPVAVVAGGLVTAFAVGGFGNRPLIAQDTPVTQLTAEQRTITHALEGAYTNIADSASPATVYITSTFERPVPVAFDNGGDSNGEQDGSPFDGLPMPFGNGPFGNRGGAGRMMPQPRTGRASGSGAIIDPRGYIITNDHVVANAINGQVKVTLTDNRVFTGRVFRDPQSDVALVKIDAGRPLPYLRLADSDKVRVGQLAVAIGSPFGQQNTMTNGIVSALHRQSAIGDSADLRFYPNLIQTDASINPGNSGGPLLNINGEIIGLNVAIYSPSGTSVGIGYAIPANTVKTVVTQLINKGSVTRGYLGIEPTDIPVALRDRVGVPGARVKSVTDNSPAGRGGLRAGDIITRFGDRDITGEITLRDAIAVTTPGTRVPVSILRAGQVSNVTVSLEAFPDRFGLAGRSVTPRRTPQNSKLGIKTSPVTSEVVSELGLPAGTSRDGILVEGVQQGSAASDAGLISGDIIRQINGKPATDESTHAVAQVAKSGDVITFTVTRVTPGLTDQTRRETVQLVIDITVP